MQYVFIIGAKGFTYGGYETFLDKLTEYHQNNSNIQYHIACKANGNGKTDERMLPNVKVLSETEYMYHNAHCFKIHAPNLGAAQAVFYDIKSLQYVCNYIKTHNIREPIVYILSSRIGIAIRHYAKRIHKLGGQYWHNPDGREGLRKKYIWIVRQYWQASERKMVKYADLEVCDSRNIEKYIRSRYRKYHPETTFIAYGSDIMPSKMADDAPAFMNWLKRFGLTKHNYYLSVGRFVPENNFETMIREFMSSRTQKDFAIITTDNPKFLNRLDKKLHFSRDRRIKFVGTVYDQELLKKIREGAYAYLHGHSVGGTNPSLLEALGSTKLNLLYDIGFNREVGEDAAVYWKLDHGSLADQIENAEAMSEEEISRMGEKAKARISSAYSWQLIADRYLARFIEK